MAEKRKASGDAPGTPPAPPARMRTASTDDEDFSHGGDPGSGRERKRLEVVPPPQHLPVAGMDANVTDNSRRIDSFARAVDEEASSPSGNGEELPAAAGKLQPPPPSPNQPVEAAEAPLPLPNDEQNASDDAPGSGRGGRERNASDDAPARSDDSPNFGTVEGATVLAHMKAGLLRGKMEILIEQEEVTSSLRPVPSSAPASPSGSEEQLAAAAAARAKVSRAADHPADQPAEAEAQPLPSDDESVGSVPEMVVPAHDR